MASGRDPFWAGASLVAPLFAITVSKNTHIRHTTPWLQVQREHIRGDLKASVAKAASLDIIWSNSYPNAP